ncbi:hypothetical protein O987_16050 [Comamonas testosteroni TK102]|uniref:Uncharacterized protein n=1 Tax=Comamonas testosteroni TK102 TaxID=1392005 RepID=A0A076PU84_COMTE|nr:hypothetical protein O987_16050 [Comamonas testosteroni TK102]
MIWIAKSPVGTGLGMKATACLQVPILQMQQVEDRGCADLVVWHQQGLAMMPD